MFYCSTGEGWISGIFPGFTLPASIISCMFFIPWQLSTAVILCHFESGNVCNTAYFIEAFFKLVLIKGFAIRVRSLEAPHYLQYREKDTRAREICPLSCWWQNHSQGEREYGGFCMIISCSTETLKPLQSSKSSHRGTNGDKITVPLNPPLRVNGKPICFQILAVCFIFLCFSLCSCIKRDKIQLLNVVGFDISAEVHEDFPYFSLPCKGDTADFF